MEHYAGLDVSLELTSVCIVDARGGIICEVKVASEPEALIRFFSEQVWSLRRSAGSRSAVAVAPCGADGCWL